MRNVVPIARIERTLRGPSKKIQYSEETSLRRTMGDVGQESGVVSGD
jgi:hypothetical protein